MVDISQQIASRLTEVLQPTSLELRDDSAAHVGHVGNRGHGGGHFCLSIASDRFDGCSLPQCHRLVYDALDGMFTEQIHALSINIQRN
ncbi:MAG: BolA family protein [Mariprofundales bacterium]